MREVPVVRNIVLNDAWAQTIACLSLDIVMLVEDIVVDDINVVWSMVYQAVLHRSKN